MRRQRRLLARGVALVGAHYCLRAPPTAVFNATYEAQAAVDARLRNGADVTVTGAPGAADADTVQAISHIRGS